MKLSPDVMGDGRIVVSGGISGQVSILSTLYKQIFEQKFVQSQTLSREKLLKRLSYEKCACKMLMKLKAGVPNFVIISRSAF